LKSGFESVWAPSTRICSEVAFSTDYWLAAPDRAYGEEAAWNRDNADIFGEAICPGSPQGKPVNQPIEGELGQICYG